jgi:hypothetical protein
LAAELQGFGLRNAMHDAASARVVSREVASSELGHVRPLGLWVAGLIRSRQETSTELRLTAAPVQKQPSCPP